MLRRNRSTNSVVGDMFKPLYDARTSALRKNHECSLNISLGVGIPVFILDIGYTIEISDSSLDNIRKRDSIIAFGDVAI